MQKPYLAPELKLAGEAEDIVLGGGGGGTDIFGDDYWDEAQYATDQDDSSRR